MFYLDYKLNKNIDYKFIYCNKPDTIYTAIDKNIIIFNKKESVVNGKYHKWKAIYYINDSGDIEYNILQIIKDRGIFNTSTNYIVRWKKLLGCYNRMFFYFECEVCNIGSDLISKERGSNLDFVEYSYELNNILFEANYSNVPCNDIIIYNILE